MAESIREIQKLKDLRPTLHIFCPRDGPDDYSYYFDEDLFGQLENESEAERRERLRRVREAEERKRQMLEGIKILAFDGPDAAPWIEWVRDRLESQLTSCDVCVRMYHKSRAELKETLERDYEAEEIAQFLELVDDMDIERIKKGLRRATDDLEARPENERTIGALDSEGLYAIFESLSCEPFLRNEPLLAEHFDRPFQLVQTRRRLRLNSYTPAMASFLFGAHDFRADWAFKEWARFKRNLSKTEFESGIRPFLYRAMLRVQLSALDFAFLPTFWTGVRAIVDKLDKNLITHSLRALDMDVCKLVLEHLQFRSDCFVDLVGTMGLLLEKAPDDFWDAMGTISASTVLDQIFNNQTLIHILRNPSPDEDEDLQNLHDAFAWVDPFIASIKVTNLTPACRTLTNHFMDRLQDDKFSRSSRRLCDRLGLLVFSRVLRRLNENRTRTSFVGVATVSEVMGVLSRHMDGILEHIIRSDGSSTEEAKTAMDVIEQAIQLECMSLETESTMITKGELVQRDQNSSSQKVWNTAIKAVSARNIPLAIVILQGSRGLVGLEPFFVKPENKDDKSAGYKDIVNFNDKFSKFSDSIADLLERLADVSARSFDQMFCSVTSASALIATLLSSDKNARQAAVEAFKSISSQDGRKEAISHFLTAHYGTAITAVSYAIRRISRTKVFTPASSLLKLSGDILDLLCNHQTGLLRRKSLNGQEAKATEVFWQSLWQVLTAIFEETENWSNRGYDKAMMMEFCRDTMQFANNLFDQCSIFANGLAETVKPSDQKMGRREYAKVLLNDPKVTMNTMVKWLRLRDEYLSTQSVSLISRLLKRLKDVGIELASDPLLYVESVVLGKIKAKLSLQQVAELQQALEVHTGQSFVTTKDERKAAKQASLNRWMAAAGGATAEKGKPLSEASSDAESQHAKLLDESTQGAAAYKAKMAARLSKPVSVGPVSQKLAQKSVVDVSEFKKKREAEKEAKRKRDAEAAARARKNIPLRTSEAGSAVHGLGVHGKDHTTKGEGMMVSSDESSDDELDRELFGLSKPHKKELRQKDNKTSILIDVPQPVKKKRIIRSAKDMRARLMPDLSPLHKAILAWDYFHDGDFPPGSDPSIYCAVPNSFRTPFDYQNTFQPLLILEAWQGFVKAREESNYKPYEIKIASRSSVDAFSEIGSTMTNEDNRQISIMEGDIVLMSKYEHATAEQAHCLARVFRIQRKKNFLEVSYRVMPGNPLISAMSPGTSIYGAKVQSITPLEREYGALLGLQYYDLCDEIIRARPSPLLKYSDKQLESIIGNYNVNKAQAKAVKSAIDNDAFTLIQGPPGSGKTKTIVAIVGALLTDSFRGSVGNVIPQPRAIGANPQQALNGGAAAKKLLVCAPSNAAVDELVMRFKEGIKTMSGQERKINVVRLGRSDAINSKILDVTLDELVAAKLNTGPNNSANQREETQKIMKEHQAVSEKLREARGKLDSGEAKGPDASKIKDEFDALRRRKAALGTQIDSARDNENTLNRQAELDRKRAQQRVLDDAHVICATLSGSGHDMFHSLNIEFETVVVDEAAQCVEISAIIPLKYGCAKCILVGDPKQLPPTVFSKEAARFQYEQSLFVRMQGNHPDYVHLLDTQYRMHPEISTFPSETFYDGKLLDGGDMTKLRRRPWHANSLLGPYRFFDVQGQHQAAPKGHSLINLAEIDVAMQLYDRLTSEFRSYSFKGKIGIITPYKSQLRELKERFLRRFGNGISETVEFNTTDAFQGRESEVIIFSCVRASASGGIGFLQDIRRMNVGLTRAKSSLWVLGNSQSLVRGEFWRKLVENARSRGKYSEGEISKLLRNSRTAAAKQEKDTGDEGVASHPKFKAEPGIKQEQRQSKATSNGQAGSRRPSTHETIAKRRESFAADKDVKMEDPPEPVPARKGSLNDSGEEIREDAGTRAKIKVEPGSKQITRKPSYDGPPGARPKVAPAKRKEYNPLMSNRPPPAKKARPNPNGPNEGRTD